MVASPTMAAAGTRKNGAAGTRHEAVGVVLVAVALLLGLSLLSYSPRDPILLEESFHPESVQNLIGQVGMTLATGVFAAVGGGGYLAPIALGILGSRCFLRGGLGVTLRSAGGFTTLLLFVSMLLALHLPGVPTIGSGWVQEGLGGGRTVAARGNSPSRIIARRSSSCRRSWTAPGTCCRTRRCCCAIRRRGWIGSPTRRSVRRRRCSPRPWRISGSTAR